MTTIEKASNLVSYYLPFCNDNLTDAKYCAIIAVSEILFALRYDMNEPTSGSIKYYQSVKQEIEKL